MRYVVENCFVKIALEGILPQKFDRKPGRANKGSQNPAKLAPQKKIARNPRDEDTAPYSVFAAPVIEQSCQAHVCVQPGDGVHIDMERLDEAVSPGMRSV